MPTQKPFQKSLEPLSRSKRDRSVSLAKLKDLAFARPTPWPKMFSREQPMRKRCPEFPFVASLCRENIFYRPNVPGSASPPSVGTICTRVRLIFGIFIYKQLSHLEHNRNEPKGCSYGHFFDGWLIRIVRDLWSNTWTPRLIEGRFAWFLLRSVATGVSRFTIMLWRLVISWSFSLLAKWYMLNHSVFRSSI